MDLCRWSHPQILSMNDTVKFMFIVQIAMYHYDMLYVKVALAFTTACTVT